MSERGLSELIAALSKITELYLLLLQLCLSLSEFYLSYVILSQLSLSILIGVLPISSHSCLFYRGLSKLIAALSELFDLLEASTIS